METKHKDNVIRFPDGSRKRVASFMMTPDGKRAAPRHHPLLVFMVRCVFMAGVAFIVMLTGGCAAETHVSRINNGIYEVTVINSGAAYMPGTSSKDTSEYQLNKDSIALCPAGYDKIMERKLSDKGVETFIWHIRCVP